MGQNYSSLSIGERTQLGLLRERKLSCWEIAAQLTGSTLTITREFVRHSDGEKGHGAADAQGQSRARRATAKVGEREFTAATGIDVDFLTPTALGNEAPT